MTANKRKRNRQEEEEQQQQQENYQELPEPEGGPVKKPHKNPPTGIIKSAIEKIAELEQYINQVADEDEDDDDYSSDYSELSGDNSANGYPVITEDNKFNPEIVGFAICAQETINFLRKEGFSADNPLVQSIQMRLLGQLNQYQVALNGGGDFGQKKK